MAKFGEGVNAQLGATNYNAYLQGALQGAQGVARGGELMGQGIASVGSSLASGIKEYQQNKTIAGTAIAKFESALTQDPSIVEGQNVPDFVKKSMEKMKNTGSLGIRDASMLAIWAEGSLLGKQKEAEQANRVVIDSINAQKAATNQTNAETALLNAKTADYNARNPLVKEPPAKTTLYNLGVEAFTAENKRAPNAQELLKIAENAFRDNPTALDAAQLAALNRNAADAAENKIKKQDQYVSGLSNQISKSNTLRTQIADARKLAEGLGTTGFVGAGVKLVLGTPAYDLAQKVVTIKANIGFDRLQQMRLDSPTGGALGQVAVQELEALQNSIASLEQAQSYSQFDKSLQTVEAHYARLQAAMEKDYSKFSPQETITVPW